VVEASTFETGVMASLSPDTDPRWPAWLFLGITVVMALLGGGLVAAFLARDDGSALGPALVSLGAAGLAAGAFRSIRRGRRR
jgi:hypothetical protein